MIVHVKEGTVIMTESVIMEDFNYIFIDSKTSVQNPKKIV